MLTTWTMALFVVRVFKKEELKMLLRWSPTRHGCGPGEKIWGYRDAGKDGWQYEDMGKAAIFKWGSRKREPCWSFDPGFVDSRTVFLNHPAPLLFFFLWQHVQTKPGTMLRTFCSSSPLLSPLSYRTHTFIISLPARDIKFRLKSQ